MSITRRQILKAGALTALAAAPFRFAFAQGSDWPKKPIKVVVPSAAGGDTDFNARTIAKYFEQITKVPMIVTNTTGASGTIALAEVEGADPDGNTLFFGHSGQLIVTELFGLRKHKFDDQLSIACIPAVDKGSVLVSGPSRGITTLEKFLETAKANPGKVIYGTEFGGLTHLQGLFLSKAADIKLKIVDVGGASDKITALLGKRIDVGSIAFGPVKDYVNTHKLAALAQFTYPSNPLLPQDIKPFKDQGVDFSMDNPYVMAFPKKTSPEIVQKMSDLVKQITENKEYADALAKTYSQPVTFFPGAEAVAELNRIRDKYLPFQDLLRQK